MSHSATPTGTSTPLEDASDELDLDDVDPVISQFNLRQKLNGQQPSTTGTPNTESDELARFREEWRAEVSRRAKEQQPTVTQVSKDTLSPTTEVASDHYDQPKLAGPSSSASNTRAHGPSITISAAGIQASSQGTKLNLPKRSLNALELYREAIENEQAGNLDEALRLYQLAFRTEPVVDKLYAREEQLAAVLNIHTLPVSDEHKPTSHPTEVTIPITDHLPPVKLSGPLAQLVQSFPHDLTFEPMDEALGPPGIALLPPEILIHICHMLDHTSLERFASVNRKARLLTLEMSIWRDLVEKTLKPPQIKTMDTLTTILDQSLWDYRRVYVEQPRLRTDGVYIALNQYLRHGQSDNQWVNVSHLITYYRYLRFFPNGQVYSLLVQGEEYSPSQIIPILKPGLRMKDLLIGKWALIGTEIQILDLVDASGKFRLPAGFTLPGSDSFVPPHDPHLTLEHPPEHHAHHSHHHNRGDEPRDLRYAFTMSLSLKSKPVLGRWNRLDMLSYDSVNLENGDSVPVSLGKEKPFWFSRVRSYV